MFFVTSRNGQNHKLTCFGVSCYARGRDCFYFILDFVCYCKITYTCVYDVHNVSWVTSLHVVVLDLEKLKAFFFSSKIYIFIFSSRINSVYHIYFFTHMSNAKNFENQTGIKFNKNDWFYISANVLSVESKNHTF